MAVKPSRTKDVAAVVAALNSDWLTTGPQVDAFELAFAAFCGARCGVAVNSGTAALHAAIRALKIGTGDEVMVPAITFVASANCAAYEGATPVFADVDPQTLLIDPASVAARITERTEAIVVVDYAGPTGRLGMRSMRSPRNMASRASPTRVIRRAVPTRAGRSELWRISPLFRFIQSSI
jgi:dTDP-4-amino-4,6-dideoxygalactose transaminase